MKILIVCKGNRARSPIGEHMLRLTLEQRGHTDVTVESAGTLREAENMPPMPEAIIAARKVGIDISGHRSRWIGSLDLSTYDTIICLDPMIHKTVMSMNPPEKLQIIVANGRSGGIPDPLPMGQVAYDGVTRLLYEFLSRLDISRFAPRV